MAVVFAVFLLSLPSRGSAVDTVPNTINYQGTLTDGAGQPINGTKNIVFSLYSVPSAGVAFWTSGTKIVTVTNGSFSVTLGGSPVLNPTSLTGTTYIGIKVESDPEMAPRQQFSSVAYAMKAGNVVVPPDPIPAGVIVMWSGALAAVPTGWALCDGNNGTPNLRDKFVVGAGSGYGAGSTGGSATKDISHSHAGPSHSHTVNSHNHKGYGNGGDLRAAIGIVGSDDKLAMVDAPAGNPNGGAVPGPSRVSDINAPGSFVAWQNWVAVYGYTSNEAPATSQGGIDPTGVAGSATQNFLPPYFALAYIMKL